MKRYLAILGLALPSIMMGQSAIDVYNLNSYQLRGTARFMSMGGAFTALGGDLSTLNQNPGGIGIYRNSEVGATLDIDFQQSKTNSDGFSQVNDQTKAACDNFGYIGSISLKSELMPYFSWGVSYSRQASFDKVYKGGGFLGGSLSNYVASFTNGTKTSALGGGDKWNPYSGDADWLSILSYNAYMINPVGRDGNNTRYNGLWQLGTTGDATFSTIQSGYVDEYSIDFGGNLKNVVFWGLGIGITDIRFLSTTVYDEKLADARISRGDATDISATTNGNAYFELKNWYRTSGSGFNFKVGLIVKPINELRIGAAIHTPTYYNLSTAYNSDVDFDYTQPDGAITVSSYKGGNATPSQSDQAYYDWKMQTPWKFMVGAAGVLGGKAIVSLDYEHQAYSAMKARDNSGYDLTETNGDIKDYFKASDIVRVGAEYRVSSHFSIRAGFNYQTTDVRNDAMDDKNVIYTSGTNPAYTLDKNTYCVTAGVGYRYKGFYADLAYIYRRSESEWHGFTPLGYDSSSESYFNTGAPTASLAETNNHIALTVGFKF